MRIIISPAKKMREDLDSFSPRDLPQFLPDTEQLKAAMQAMTEAELQNLWKCNTAIAEQNWVRLQNMELHSRLTPAIISYEGIQYQYMAPGVLEDGQLDYLQEHLRILSGFYGLLRPFDGITPYRLEMQARLSVKEHKNLYDFWGEKLAKQLASETDFVLNLASKEYSRAVEPYLQGKAVLCSCRFAERKEGKLVEKGTMCKMARGQMVRWLAEHAVTRAEEIRGFAELGYRFSSGDSTESQMVFLKGGS